MKTFARLSLGQEVRKCFSYHRSSYWPKGFFVGWSCNDRQHAISLFQRGTFDEWNDGKLSSVSEVLGFLVAQNLNEAVDSFKGEYLEK